MPPVPGNSKGGEGVPTLQKESEYLGHVICSTLLACMIYYVRSHTYIRDCPIIHFFFNKNVKFWVEARDFLNFPILSPKILLILRYSNSWEHS